MLVFLAAAVLVYTLFMIYPLFNSLWLSLNNKAPAGGSEFVGVQNYQTFLSQERWAPQCAAVARTEWRELASLLGCCNSE